MKIAFLVSEFPSLSQTFVLNQITGLLDRGHAIDIFARRRGDETKVHEDVNKYHLLSRTRYFLKVPRSRFLRFFEALWLIGKFLPRNPAAVLNTLNVFKHGKASVSLSLLFQTVPFLGNNNFDVILCHFGINGNIAVTLREADVITGKIVTVFHGYDLTSYLAKTDKDVYQKLFARGDLFQPISKRWEKKLIDLGCDSQKISVHRMGIDVDKIEPRASSHTRNGCIKLLSVSRLVEKKGIEFGIQAISKLIESYPNVEYVIVGDGPLQKELSDLIDRLKLNRIVKLTGWRNQEEIFGFMQESDILIAPSVTGKTGDQEGIPVALMEAMAHGLPVVSTLHSGIPELVIDSKTGFLVGERDPEALAKKIEILITNPDIRCRFGAEGRKKVEADYNIHTLNDDLVNCFLKLAHH